MQTEEYVPHTIPTIRGSANSRIEDTPRINSTNTMMNVVKEVLILLVNVCVILKFTISESSILLFTFKFSRIRSKITIVALME